VIKKVGKRFWEGGSVVPVMRYPDLCASMSNFGHESTRYWFERLFDS